MLVHLPEADLRETQARFGRFAEISVSRATKGAHKDETE